MAYEDLTEEQKQLIHQAESLGIDTLGFTVPNARFDRLQALIEERMAEDAESEIDDLVTGEHPDPAVGSELTHYVDKAMYEAEPMDTAGVEDGPRVHMIAATPDPLGAIGAMCSMYEGRVIRSLEDLNDEDRRRYWDQVSKTHLKAPLEAVDFMFLIEGVTRAFTHQLVRQRTAVYAQESLRFAVKEEIAARPGPIISGNKPALSVWSDAVDMAWTAYRGLIASGVPAEEARGLLPHDTLTRVIYKTNLRNLLEHAGNRLCTQAQFEWRLVFAGIIAAIRDYDPPRELTRSTGQGHSLTKWQFPVIAESKGFAPVCYAVGRCPFKAEFDRGCTIRERVDEGRFEEINPMEWLADPTAGWVR